MSTMLSTVNPDEVARMADTRPIPGQGDSVRYFLRPGQVHSARRSAAALVLKSDPDNGLLDLFVIYGHDDTMTVERVPRRIGDEMGWDYRENSSDAALVAARQEIAALTERFESFMDEMSDALWGKHDRPAGSVEDRLIKLEKPKAPTKTK